MAGSIKSTVKHYIGRCIFNTATRISPVLNTQLRFLQVNKRFANLKSPQSLTEKLSWLKLNYYNTDPLVIKCADKFCVREYVKECGFEDNLIPVIATYSSPKEICWEKLPNKFVLKWNFGSGYNILCKDKRTFDTAEAIKKLKKWQKNNYHLKYAELQYKNIACKTIICEQYLDTPENEELLDYKLYCFHGKVKAILVIARYENDGKAAVFMSPDWKILSTEVHEKYKSSIIPDRPHSLSEMIIVAESIFTFKSTNKAKIKPAKNAKTVPIIKERLRNLTLCLLIKSFKPIFSIISLLK